MIIDLGKYNKVRELLIGIDTTESLGQVTYQDMELEGICN